MFEVDEFPLVDVKIPFEISVIPEYWKQDAPVPIVPIDVKPRRRG
jgi:hypothetical protein